MESLGNRLIKAREAKSWTVRDLEERTRIQARYIIALEKENYAELPGEVYVRGFLKNISEHLGLDPDQTLELYKRNRLADAPAPYEELLKKPEVNYAKYTPLLITIGVGVLLAILILVILIAFGVIDFGSRDIPKDFPTSRAESARTNSIVEDRMTVQVQAGSTILFRPLGVSAMIRITSIGNTVRATVNGKDIAFTKDNPALEDLNQNGIPDFRMRLIDVIEDVAQIELEKVPEELIYAPEQSAVTPSSRASQTEPPAIATAPSAEPARIVEVETRDDAIFVFRDVAKEQIAIDILAKGSVYIRYFIDAQRPVVESLYDGKALNLVGRDSITISVGNASRLVMKVNGKTIPLAGDTVQNKIVKWEQNPNDETKFNLVVRPQR